MRVAVDPDKCVGSGQCVMVAERVFDQRPEDGVAEPIAATPAAAEEPAARRAARLCPTSAITVVEE